MCTLVWEQEETFVPRILAEFPLHSHLASSSAKPALGAEIQLSCGDRADIQCEIKISSLRASTQG